MHSQQLSINSPLVSQFFPRNPMSMLNQLFNRGLLGVKWECSSELREAVASIIFPSPKCSDLPDLLHVQNLFAAKYGKEFIAAATELRPDTSVIRTIIEKLTVSAPPPQVKLRVLKEITLEHSVDWDSTKTEAEFGKKPEDLLHPCCWCVRIFKGSEFRTEFTFI
ncbi:uncharacterized protein LOC142543585 isoform X2 [Primulina tabacum]|uniref:uncharacterized protein LOC142543585 isoform X2 n=1 Tax=Primulina tabacum TaxID=48773 RepID=UPI003F5A2350